MWHTQSASVTGRGHSKRGVSCQDRSYNLRVGDVTAIALADGAGSSPISQEGADCAVRVACEVLCNRFDALRACASPLEAKQEVLAPILRELKRRAAELGTELSLLASTLLGVAVRGGDYLIIHVGDGVIGYRKGNRLLVASAPQNGEFANRTTFLTSPDVLRRARILRGTQDEIDGYVLMTDGCEAALYHKQNHRLALAVNLLLNRSGLLAQERSQQLLDDLLAEVVAPRTQDDCSLAVLSRTSGECGWSRLTQRDKARLLAIATEDRVRRRRKLRQYERACKIFSAHP